MTQRSSYDCRFIGGKNFIRRAWRRFIYRFIFGFCEQFGVHVLPADYTSPVPDTRDLRRRQAEWYKASEMPGVELNLPEQVQLLKSLEIYKNEFCELPEHDDLVRAGIGLGFGDVEAHILYAMVRLFRPAKILEVGSGVSTYYSDLALKKNGPGSICCVEPYPMKQFEAYAACQQISLLRTVAQSLDWSVFESLGKNDILFIDSSHILKLGSDVWFLYLEALPRLRPGVLVHVHDICFPFPCPEPNEWIMRRHQFWNESALLQAMLCGNSHLHIILCSSFLAFSHPSELSRVFPIYDPRKSAPASIWLRVL